jgi:hypothetical protein
MNPLIVYEVTIPSSHRTTRIVKIVQSMSTPNSFSLAQARSRSTQEREGKLTCEPALTSSPHCILDGFGAVRCSLTHTFEISCPGHFAGFPATVGAGVNNFN